MKRRPLPIPQHEFGFTPDTFNLIQDTATDGEKPRRRAVQRTSHSSEGSFMPADLKPLFRPEAVRPKVKAFALPDAAAKVLAEIPAG